MILINLSTKKEYFLPLKKSAGEEATTCPECSESRKKKTLKCFSYNHEMNTGHCSHCQMTVVLKREFEPKKEYKRPVWRNQTQLSINLVKWFEGRGINQQTLIDFKITEGPEWMPQTGKEENTVQFNYLRDGELVNIKYRTGNKDFKLFKDGELILYNLDAIKEGEEVVICEGEIDALSISQAGYKYVVSVPNGAGNGKINLDYLDNCIEYFYNKKVILLATDDDLPGRNLQEQLAERLGKERCFKVKFKDCKDANDCLIKYGVQGIIESIVDRKEFPLEGVFNVSDYADEIEDLYHKGLPKGAKTQMANLNKLISFHKGYFTTITGIPNQGKALCVNTDIPTPTGWKKMSELQVGDEVFNENGEIIEVIWESGIMLNRPCYKIVFSDNTEVIADEQHLWLTEDFKSRCSFRNSRAKNRLTERPLKPNGTDQTYKKTFPSVKNTLDISNSLKAEKGKRYNHNVKLCSPLVLKDKDCLINPYVLGLWLGDGRRKFGQITIGDNDIVAEIEKRGFVLTKYNSKYQYGIGGGFITKIRQLNLYDNKHIPTSYLRGSYEQRLELLQGLMDSDGYCGKDNICEFCNINKKLAYDTYELITSLGIKATINEYDAKLYGRYISKKYRIIFTTNRPVFKLKRKLARLPEKIRNPNRYITDCKKIESVPVKCISVSGTSKLFLCTKSFIPTHNSDSVDQITLDLSLTSDWKGAFYSPENKPTSLHISKLARKLIGKSWWGDDRISKHEIKMCISYLNERFFFLKPEKDFTLDTILESIKGLILRKGIDFFVIDAWNKIEHKYTGDENRYIGECLDKVANFCEHNAVHGFIVAHPRKMLKQKGTQKFEIPNLYDINGSANWFNKSDNGICIYRDYDREISQWYVQKVKFSHWGSTGFCEFKYDLASGRFNEYTSGVPVINNTPWIYEVGKPLPEQVINTGGIVMDDGQNHVF